MHVAQWISVASVCIATGLGQAATITVDDDLQDLPTADYTNIQAAVDAASDGDEVVVYPGTYTDTQDGHVVNMLGKAITLRSTGTADVTIIDGENARRGIVCVNAEPSSTTIDGFTISGGLSVEYDYDGDGSADWWEDDGGGILCYYSDPTITNCTISGNTGNFGGGILCSYNSDPTITNCTITNNTATHYGGGIYSNTSSSPTISGCTISGNTSSQDGGGIYCSSSSPAITGCQIVNNTATSDGGGIFCGGNSHPAIVDCVIAGNAATWRGGGIWCYQAPQITGCVISNNSGGQGGGIYGGTPVLTNTTVCGNDPDQVDSGWTDNGGNEILEVCPLGACCTNGGCVISEPDDCVTFLGTWLGGNASCDDCPASCSGDTNGDGVVDIEDLLNMMGSWGACP